MESQANSLETMFDPESNLPASSSIDVNNTGHSEKSLGIVCEDSPETESGMVDVETDEMTTNLTQDEGDILEASSKLSGVLENEENSLLDGGDHSEHTDDEDDNDDRSSIDLDPGESISNEVSEGKIAIFEYSGEGLTKKSHLSLKQKDLMKDSADLSEEEAESFQCHTCGTVCSTWTGFRTHLKSHSNQDNFDCPLCSKRFQTKNILERHVQTYHLKERPYICQFCGKGFSTEWYCQKHETHHEKGTGPRILARDMIYACKYCEKTFPKPRQLRMHESTHTGEKNYECKQCDKTFCYSSSLLKHLKYMHSEKPKAVCEFCSRVFSTGDSLLKHKQYHVGVDQFKCRKCDTIFRDFLSLKRHGRSVHYNEIERPHKCDSCNRGFTHKSLLEIHLRCHTGERPYVCPFCKKRFRQNSQLKTHVRSHSLERPYVCNTCGKSYAEYGSLQRHERCHTGEKPFTCTVCQKSFAIRHVLNRHMKTHSTSDTPAKDPDPSQQDAEILALALKSFVQSMEKAQEVQRNSEVAGLSSNEASVPISDQLSQGPLPLTEIPKTQVSTKAIVNAHSLPQTKFQTAQGTVEILSFEIEDEINARVDTEGQATLSSHAINTVHQETATDHQEEETPAVSVDIAGAISVSDSQTFASNQAGNAAFQLNIPDEFISPSILENPNMERIRHRYNRKPQRVEALFLDAGEDVEVGNALMEMGSTSGEVSSTGHINPDEEKSKDSEEIFVVTETGDDSEATDDEMDDYGELEDLDEDDHKTADRNEEKVFESLSIFEMSGEDLVYKGKIDVFEHKFHKKCNICKKSFFSQGGYDQHMKRHECGPDFPFICQYCGRRFAAKLSLTAHEAIHTGKTLYKCKFCPREFRNYSSHRIHTATHTGLKPYPCQYCSKSFAQMAHVQRHERTHTGHKPYACEFCNKAFAEWGTWQRHTRTHTGEKPYVCGTCGKGFIVKFALRRHLKTHRNENGDSSPSSSMIYIPAKESIRLRGERSTDDLPSQPKMMETEQHKANITEVTVHDSM